MVELTTIPILMLVVLSANLVKSLLLVLPVDSDFSSYQESFLSNCFTRNYPDCFRTMTMPSKSVQVKNEERQLDKSLKKNSSTEPCGWFNLPLFQPDWTPRWICTEGQVSLLILWKGGLSFVSLVDKWVVISRRIWCKQIILFNKLPKNCFIGETKSCLCLKITWRSIKKQKAGIPPDENSFIFHLVYVRRQF